jgi:hypothetical protein
MSMATLPNKPCHLWFWTGLPPSYLTHLVKIKEGAGRLRNHSCFVALQLPSVKTTKFGLRHLWCPQSLPYMYKPSLNELYKPWYLWCPWLLCQISHLIYDILDRQIGHVKYPTATLPKKPYYQWYPWPLCQISHLRYPRPLCQISNLIYDIHDHSAK